MNPLILLFYKSFYYIAKYLSSCFLSKYFLSILKRFIYHAFVLNFLENGYRTKYFTTFLSTKYSKAHNKLQNILQCPFYNALNFTMFFFYNAGKPLRTKSCHCTVYIFQTALSSIDYYLLFLIDWSKKPVKYPSGICYRLYIFFSMYRVYYYTHFDRKN